MPARLFLADRWIDSKILVLRKIGQLIVAERLILKEVVQTLPDNSQKIAGVSEPDSEKFYPGKDINVSNILGD